MPCIKLLFRRPIASLSLAFEVSSSYFFHVKPKIYLFIIVYYIEKKEKNYSGQNYKMSCMHILSFRYFLLVQFVIPSPSFLLPYDYPEEYIQLTCVTFFYARSNGKQITNIYALIITRRSSDPGDCWPSPVISTASRFGSRCHARSQPKPVTRHIRSLFLHMLWPVGCLRHPFIRATVQVERSIHPRRRGCSHSWPWPGGVGDALASCNKQRVASSPLAYMTDLAKLISLYKVLK